MPPRSKPDYAPLDVESTRAAVAAGRTVRVGILPTHQFPDGAAGRIRQVGAPDTDGPEFIQVEISVGGTKDVIPFAPTDLSPIKRTQTAPEPLKAAPRRRLGVARAASNGAVAPKSSSPEPGTPAMFPAVDPAPIAAGGPSSASGGTEPEAPVVRRSARGKRQPIVITLATTDPDHTGWQLEVKVGSRLVVKPTAIHPARAWALVTDLGNPEVARVVAGALNEHRQQAQEKADRLARELAEAQAELADYPIF